MFDLVIHKKKWTQKEGFYDWRSEASYLMYVPGIYYLKQRLVKYQFVKFYKKFIS